MSYFKAKVHQIQFRLGFCPRPFWGSLQHSPNALAGYKGPTSKGREGRRGRIGRKGKGRGIEDGRIDEGRGGEGKAKDRRCGKMEGEGLPYGC